MTTLAVAFGCGVVALGCGEQNDSGSSGLIPIPPIDVTGTWTGTWTGTDKLGNPVSGAIEFQLVQIDPTVPGISSVAGTTTFTDFFDGVDPMECFTSGAFVGSITGVKISVISILDVPRDPPQGRPITLALNVGGTLDALGNVMRGSYVVNKGKPLPGRGNGPDCSGLSGTIEVTRPTAP